MRPATLFTLPFFWFTFGFSQPPPRHLEKVAFDQQRNKLIMYGGGVMVDGVLTEFTTLYEWDPSGWKEYDASGPGGRNGHALVYHDAEKVTLLMGGITEKQKPYTIHYDVWRWNGQDWKRIDSNFPVKEPQAVYDPAKQRVLVYGDVSDKTKLTDGDDQRFELWAYQSNRWQKLSANGPHPDGPYQIAYDIKRQSLVTLDWEEGNIIVWEWKNGEWKKVPCTGNCPPPRTRYSLIHHPDEQATYLFGGFTDDDQQLDDFWKWNGRQWKRVEAKASPSKRNSAHFAYFDNRLVLYGGAVPLPGSPGRITLCNELWQWKDGVWKQLE